MNAADNRAAIVANGATTRRLLTILDRAPVDTITNGLDWYDAAHRIAAGMADHYGHAVGTVADLIAVLSPQCGWTRNLERARHMLTTGASPGLFEHRGAAVLAGVPLDQIVTGPAPKIRAFARNIAHPTRPGPVTVDRHAIDAAMGWTDATGPDRKILDRAGVYDAVAECYRSAAARAGILPHQFQAIVWTDHRNRKGIAA